MLILKKKMATVLDIFSANGISGLSSMLLKKIFPSGNWFMSWDQRVLLECPTDSLSLLPPPNSFNAKPISAHDARLLEGINNQSLGSINAAINRQEVCWVIEDNGVLVSYVWISKNKIDVCSDTAFILPTNNLSYWWRDIYINPDYRGTGKINQHLSTWFHSLNTSQASNLFCEISPENLPSLISHQRNGFIVKGQLKMFCFLGFRTFHYSTSESTNISYRFYPKNIYYASA